MVLRAREQVGVEADQLAAAESLGVELEFFTNYPARRTQLLMRAGRYAEAAVVADSLTARGYFSGLPYATNSVAQMDAAWVFNLYLLLGRPALAESLVTELLGPVVRQGQLDSARVITGILSLFTLRTGPRTPPAFPDVPVGAREAMLGCWGRTRHRRRAAGPTSRHTDPLDLRGRVTTTPSRDR